MRIGVVFPQTELGGDPGAVRAYGQRVEQLGYTHVLAYDHVVGAIGAWADRGATHLSVNTMGAGLRTVDDHLAVLEAIAAAQA